MIIRASIRLDSNRNDISDLSCLQTIHEVDLLCHLWQQYVSTALLPLASTSVTVRREMVIFNNQTVSRVEGAANALLNRLIDCEWYPSHFLAIHWHPISLISNCSVAFVATHETEKEWIQASKRWAFIRKHGTLWCLLCHAGKGSRCCEAEFERQELREFPNGCWS